VRLKGPPCLKYSVLYCRKGFRGVRKVIEKFYMCALFVLPLLYCRVAHSVNKAIMFRIVRNWTEA